MNKDRTIREWFSLLLATSLLLAHQTASAQQPVKQGENLFMAHCAKCHGRSGEGFLQLYPPIHNTRYLKEKVDQMPCIIRNGMRGSIEVDGITFNQIMPGNQRISVEDMAVLINYLQKKWGHPITELTIAEPIRCE